MGLKINFAEIEEKSFELVSGGKYKMMVAAYDEIGRAHV